MQRINISGYEKNEIYYNDELFSILNENIIFNLDQDRFYIYKHHKDSNKIKLFQTIKIEYQRTGFGYKKFFVCPVCGARRQFLYLHDDSLCFVCRKCLGSNVYKERTSIYDENIENIIKYKIVQQLKLLSNPIAKVCMIDLPEGVPQRPRYMREDKYSLIYMRIAFLTWMYWQHVGGKQDFTVSEINEMLEETNTLFAYDTFLFRCFYPETDLIIREYENANRY